MKIDKKVYGYIDYELKHYNENTKKIDEIRANIIEASPEPSDGQPKRQGGTGKPTERKAIKLVSSTALLKMESTNDAIKKVYKQLEKNYKDFFDWNYIKQVEIVRTCQEVNISEATFYRWRDKIVYAVGEEMGII